VADGAGVHPALGRVVDTWETAGIRWCFLHPPADPAAPRGDLDILIHPVDMDAAARALVGLGFARLPRGERGAHFLGFDESQGQWLWLHLVNELTFGPYRVLRTAAAEACVLRRAPGPLPVLDPSDEFWATLLHRLLDRGSLTDAHRARLTVLRPSARTDGELPASLPRVFPGGWTAGRMLEAVDGGHWATLEAVGRAAARECERRARRELGPRLAAAARKLRGRVRAARGMRGVGVALLGPDGAGKSTLAAGLQRTFPLPVRQVYMGLTGGMLRRVDKLRIPGVVRAGRLLVIWSRYLRAQYHLARGRLVVFDRYIYDSEVPTPFPLGPSARVARWIDGHACPGPDVVVILDAPGAVMHERKGEYDPAMLEEWRERFRGVRRRAPDAEIVDASRAPEVVLRDVSARVWRRYLARWQPG
jgi:thymidylate kinase